MANTANGRGLNGIFTGYAEKCKNRDAQRETVRRRGNHGHRVTAILLSIVMIFCCVPVISPSYGAVTEVPQLGAQSAVLINADTGEILYDKYKDYPCFPASTTKVMTALLALENLDLDQVCTISHNASFTEGSRIFLLEGEQVTVEQLLYAMMLASANDAAIALAEACGGDVETFASMMNERARELGAENTNFVTPNGLPDDSHVTSAQDMALFAQAAMKNEKFREIVSTYEYTIPPTNLQPEERLIHNTNRLLYDTKSKADINGEVVSYKYEGILGIKTGYTDAARSCLVAAAERNGMTLIGVVYRTEPEQLYPDMIQLLDFGFENFEPVDLGIRSGDIVGKASIAGGKKHKVEVTVAKDICATAELMPEENSGSSDNHGITYEIKSDRVRAPIEKGAKVGTLVIKRGDTTLTEYDVFALESVEESAFWGFFADLSIFRVLLILVLLIILAAAAAYIVLARRMRKKMTAEAVSRRDAREQRRRESEEREAKDDLTIRYRTAQLRLEEIRSRSQKSPSSDESE